MKNNSEDNLASTNKNAVVLWLPVSMGETNEAPLLAIYPNYDSAKMFFNDLGGKNVVRVIFLGEDREDFSPPGSWHKYKKIFTNPLIPDGNKCAVLWHTEEGLQRLFFSNYLRAKVYYKTISPKYARVIFQGEEREDFYADGSWTEWKTVFLNPFLKEVKRNLVYWHDQQGLQRKFFNDLEAAKKYYQEISSQYAKALWSETERVEFYADASWDKWKDIFVCPFECGREVAVLWHADGLQQKFFAASELGLAREFLAALSSNFAKVLWQGNRSEGFYAHASWDRWKIIFASPYVCN